MDLQNEIIESFTLENYNRDNEWKHDDTDREESDGHSSVEIIITVCVLQLDDIHSSDGFEVVPDKLVSIDEHCNQKAEKHNVEDKYKQGDENLSFRERVLGKVLLAIKSIKDIQNDLEERRSFNLEFRVKLSTNNDEETKWKPKSDEELLKLTDHLVDHHNKLSKLLGSLKHHNHNQTVLANNDRNNYTKGKSVCLSQKSKHKSNIFFIFI